MCRRRSNRVLLEDKKEQIQTVEKSSIACSVTWATYTAHGSAQVVAQVLVTCALGQGKLVENQTSVFCAENSTPDFWKLSLFSYER